MSLVQKLGDIFCTRFKNLAIVKKGDFLDEFQIMATREPREKIRRSFSARFETWQFSNLVPKNWPICATRFEYFAIRTPRPRKSNDFFGDI